MHQTKPRKKVIRSGAMLLNKGMMKKRDTLNVEHTRVYQV
jgi:hypothetical protein